MRFLALLALLAAFTSPAQAIILNPGGSGTVGPSCTGTLQQLAVCHTVANNPLCAHGRLGDFEWEIGNSSSVLMSGQVGSSVNQYTVVQLDSGTKFIEAIARVQAVGGISSLSSDSVLHLHQMSGYTNQPNTCPNGGTILTCLIQPNSSSCPSSSGYTVDGAVVPSNGYGALCPLNVGLFTYSPANFQTEAAFDAPSSFYNTGINGLSDAVNVLLTVPSIAGVSISNGNPTITNTGNNGLAAGMRVYMKGTVPAPFVNFTANTGTIPVYYVTNINAAPTATSFQLSLTKGTSGAAIMPTASSSLVTILANPFTYSIPLLAGGADNSAAGVRYVLQQILASNLLMNGALGAYPVATNYLGTPTLARNTFVPTETAGNSVGETVWDGTASPFSTTTVTSSTTIGSSGPNGPWLLNGISQTNSTGQGSSPVPENWLYSLGHWVLSDPAANGDYAFSSPGTKGFTPWISHDKTLYAILSRVNSTAGVGYQSAQCLRLITKAWQSSTQQTGTIPSP